MGCCEGLLSFRRGPRWPPRLPPPPSFSALCASRCCRPSCSCCRYNLVYVCQAEQTLFSLPFSGDGFRTATQENQVRTGILVPTLQTAHHGVWCSVHNRFLVCPSPARGPRTFSKMTPHTHRPPTFIRHLTALPQPCGLIASVRDS